MSSFIERFSIAGGAGVLALVVVLGVFGLAILSVGPHDPAATKLRELTNYVYQALTVTS